MNSIIIARTRLKQSLDEGEDLDPEDRRRAQQRLGDFRYAQQLLDGKVGLKVEGLDDLKDKSLKEVCKDGKVAHYRTLDGEKLRTKARTVWNIKQWNEKQWSKKYKSKKWSPIGWNKLNHKRDKKPKGKKRRMK